MNRINSLYELIKQKSQEKRRPLKIICDWDETIQPLKPAMIYEKMSPDAGISFSEFTESFWENTDFTNPENLTGGGFGKKIRSYVKGFTGKEEEKKAIKKYEEEKLEMKENPYKWESYAKSFYGRPERFQTPFLSIAEELLKAVKEDLVSELIIISAYNVGKPGTIAAIGKKNKQEATFGKLPITKIELTPQEKKREGGKTFFTTSLRWDIIKEKYSDFDIFIDDSLKAIEETKKYFPERIYVFPDYKYSRKVQAPNIYHVKNTISNLKDSDFDEVASEMKRKQEEKAKAERERERRNLTKSTESLGFGVELRLLEPLC